MATAMNDPPVEASSPPLPSNIVAPIRVHSSFFSLHVPTAKLTEQNYLTWSQFMLAMLKSNCALRFVQSTDIPPRFVTNLERELGNVNPAFTAWEEQDQALWNELHAFCNSHTKARSRQLRSQLRSLTQGSSNISEFFSKVKTLTDSLISIGTPISLEEHVDCILDENKHKSVSDALSANIAAQSPPPNFVTMPLPMPNMQSAGYNTPHKFSSRSFQIAYGSFFPNLHTGFYPNSRGGRGGRRGGQDQDMMCYAPYDNHHGTLHPAHFYGHQSGPVYGSPSMPSSHAHASRHYTTPQQYHHQDDATNPSAHRNSSFPYHINASHMHLDGSVFPSQNQGYAMNAHTGHDNSKASMWYPDSGATNHLTANPTMFHEPTKSFGPDQIYMGNGTKASISCCGNTYFNSSNPLGIDEVLLQGSLTSEGLYAFPNLVLKSGQTKSSAGFSSNNALALVSTVESTNSSSFLLWHYRLGHAHEATVKNVLTHCNMPSINKSASDFCSACCCAKAHRISSLPSTNTYTNPFDLLYVDLWGPSPMCSNSGFSQLKVSPSSTTSITHEFIPRVTSSQFSPLSSTQSLSPSPSPIIISSDQELNDHSTTDNNTDLVPTHPMVTRSKAGIDKSIVPREFLRALLV
ncbi:PREDICTED: uncharacterized protein LOC109326338 [Lupinus angustifolius]|uniref:uncharacterized protein LOC109326338 n=1 Tax=Lupinus angustifolius TaxID=3871 RepID=UPI00092EA5DE|nr:PREDICTED: uncharacterized protein LOC109326338 [Lupinus angustifolius]